MLERIEHWVVLMFENRSFDSLLGHLPHIPAEDGLRGREVRLPSPAGEVLVQAVDDPSAPLPDPGEGYGNVNVQLWGRYLPASNAGHSPYPLFPDPMVAPFNLPDAVAMVGGAARPTDVLRSVQPSTSRSASRPLTPSLS